MTKEEIIEIFDNMEFFTEEMVPIKEKIQTITEIEDSKEKEKLYKQFIQERDVVNRLLTIEENYKWEEGCKKEWYKSYFKRHVTNPNSLHNVFTGIIPKWGMKMTEEEFDVYKEVYDELFELV